MPLPFRQGAALKGGGREERLAPPQLPYRAGHVLNAARLRRGKANGRPFAPDLLDPALAVGAGHDQFADVEVGRPRDAILCRPERVVPIRLLVHAAALPSAASAAFLSAGESQTKHAAR